jgi:hypothetical protein
MLLEGIVGFAVIIAITVFVTKFVLEVTNTPVMSEEEWDAERLRIEMKPMAGGTADDVA